MILAALAEHYAGWTKADLLALELPQVEFWGSAMVKLHQERAKQK